MNSCNEALLSQVNEHLVSGKGVKTSVKKFGSCKNIKPNQAKHKQKFVIVPRHNTQLQELEELKPKSISPTRALKLRNPSQERSVANFSSPIHSLAASKKLCKKPKDRGLKTDKHKTGSKFNFDSPGPAGNAKDIEDKKNKSKDRSGIRRFSIQGFKQIEFLKNAKKNTVDLRPNKGSDLRLPEEDQIRGEESKRTQRKANGDLNKTLRLEKKLKNIEEKNGRTLKNPEKPPIDRQKKLLIEKSSKKIQDEARDKTTAEYLDKQKKLGKSKSKAKVKTVKEKLLLPRTLKKKKKISLDMGRSRIDSSPKFIKNFELNKKIKEYNAAVTIQRWFRSLDRREIIYDDYWESDSYHSSGLRTERDEWVNLLDSNYSGSNSAFVEEFKAHLLKNKVEVKKNQKSFEVLENLEQKEESSGFSSGSEGNLIVESVEIKKKPVLNIPKLTLANLKNEDFSDEESLKQVEYAENDFLQKDSNEDLSSEGSDSLDSLLLVDNKNVPAIRRVPNIKNLDLGKIKREFDSDEDNDENLSDYESIGVDEIPNSFSVPNNLGLMGSKNSKGPEIESKTISDKEKEIVKVHENFELNPDFPKQLSKEAPKVESKNKILEEKKELKRESPKTENINKTSCKEVQNIEEVKNINEVTELKSKKLKFEIKIDGKALETNNVNKEELKVNNIKSENIIKPLCKDPSPVTKVESKEKRIETTKLNEILLDSPEILMTSKDINMQYPENFLEKKEKEPKPNQTGKNVEKNEIHINFKPENNGSMLENPEKYSEYKEKFKVTQNRLQEIKDKLSEPFQIPEKISLKPNSNPSKESLSQLAKDSSSPFYPDLIKSPILSPSENFISVPEPAKPLKIVASYTPEQIAEKSSEKIQKDLENSNSPNDILQSSIVFPDPLSQSNSESSIQSSRSNSLKSPTPKPMKKSPNSSPQLSPRITDLITVFPTGPIVKSESNENKKIFTSKLFENNGELLSDRTRKFYEQSKVALKALENIHMPESKSDLVENTTKVQSTPHRPIELHSKNLSLLVSNENHIEIPEGELKLIKSPRRLDPEPETQIKEKTGKSELFRSFNPLNLDQSSSSEDESPRTLIVPKTLYLGEDPDEIVNKIINSEIYSFLRIIPFKDSEREVDSSLDFIIEYLEIMSKELKANEEEVLDAINTPAYQEPLSKLSIIQDFTNILSKFPTLELILPPDLCSELKVYFQSLDLPTRQIYLQMLFDCVNEALNYIRPFGVEGIPDPWSSKPRILFGEAELSNVFSRIISFMVKWASSKTGTFHCPESRNDEDRLMLIREEKMSALLCTDVKDEESDWLKYEEEETQIRIMLGNSIFTNMLEEIISIINN